MPAAIFSGGTKVKCLKKIFDLFGGAQIHSGTVDPSAGGGVAATIGSLYLHETTGVLYKKTAAGDTAWSDVSSTVASLTGARVYGNTTTTVTTNVYTDMVYTTEDYDIGTNMSASLFTVPTTGYYAIHASAWLRGLMQATDSLNIRIMVDGVEVSSGQFTAQVGSGAGTQIDAVVPVNDILFCTATQVIKVQIRIQAASGAPAVQNSDFYNFFTVQLVGV